MAVNPTELSEILEQIEKLKERFETLKSRASLSVNVAEIRYAQECLRILHTTSNPLTAGEITNQLVPNPDANLFPEIKRNVHVKVSATLQQLSKKRDTFIHREKNTYGVFEYRIHPKISCFPEGRNLNAIDHNQCLTIGKDHATV